MNLLAAGVLALIVALAGNAPSGAAEKEPVPAPSQPQSPAPPSGETSDAAPSPRDPGMVKEPEVTGPPGAVVTPPVVDPQMAVNPEQREDGSATREREAQPPAEAPPLQPQH